MSNDIISEKQVEIFHHEIIELIKKYQFRDRNQVCCCDVSVSQCYILEVLHSDGALTMNKLAERMHLSVSTVTRVIDQLLKKGFVKREEGLEDRRIRLIQLTEAGEDIYKKNWQNIFHSEQAILSQFPEEHRDVLISFLKKLNKAVGQWQSCCSTS